MSRLFYISFCLISSIVLSNEAAKILAVFPTPSISHQVVYRPLTQELARRGHQVTVITPDPAFPKEQTPANLTEIDVHDISYTAWRNKIVNPSTIKGRKEDLTAQVDVLLKSLCTILELQVKTDEVQKLLNDKTQFDLLLLESCVRPVIVFSHIFKAPVISISSNTPVPIIMDKMGAPTHPILYPSVIRQKINNLTLWEKNTELINHLNFENVFKYTRRRENEILKKIFGPDTPTLEELGTNIDMLFVNAHPIWERNRPVPPSVIFMGGVHQKPKKELPRELISYLDSSKNGVIYISFGTNVMPSMLPPERIRILMNVFSRLPYDVLWKWDKDELPGQTKNIRISKWLPQADLLRHPNVKLFITQGGLQSTDEAITAGVPLIGIPMFADQWFNVEQYVYHKIGFRLDLDTLTEEKLENAINTVVEDTSFRRNVVRLRSLMDDQPQTPLERAVWWTEHVLRHGGATHLRAPAANMSWTEYWELELVAVLLVSLLVILSGLTLSVCCLWRCVSKHCITTATFKKDESNLPIDHFFK